MRSRSLRKSLALRTVKRKQVSFKKANTIGVLFDATNPTLRDEISPFIQSLKKANKQVTSIAYFDSKQDISGFAFKAFNQNDLDWMGRPKQEIIKQYADQVFDILICIYKYPQPIIEYIATLSKSHFRVGPFIENTEAFDLMVDVLPEQSTQDFLNEVNFYLHKINAPNEQASI